MERCFDVCIMFYKDSDRTHKIIDATREDLTLEEVIKLINEINFCNTIIEVTINRIKDKYIIG